MSYRPSSTRIYIGNLPEDISQSEIEQLFFKFGHIREIDIKYARSIYGTTYAFLEYDDSRDAEEAVERRNGYKFGRTRLRVEFTGDRRPRRNRNKSHGPPKRTSYRVLVTGLPAESSWQDLKDHMRKVGPVGYANIENKVGIVEYEYKEDMERSIRKLNGSQFENMFHRCEIRVRPDKNSSSYRDRSYSRHHNHKTRYSRSRSPAHSYRSISRSKRSYSRHNSNDRKRETSVHNSNKNVRSDSRKKHSKSYSLSGSQRSNHHRSNSHQVEYRRSNSISRSISHSSHSHSSKSHVSEDYRSASNHSLNQKQTNNEDNSHKVNDRSNSFRSGSQNSFENDSTQKRSVSQHSGIHESITNQSHLNNESNDYSSNDFINPKSEINYKAYNLYDKEYDTALLDKLENYSPSEEISKVEA